MLICQQHGVVTSHVQQHRLQTVLGLVLMPCLLPSAAQDPAANCLCQRQTISDCRRMLSCCAVSTHQTYIPSAWYQHASQHHSVVMSAETAEMSRKSRSPARQSFPVVHCWLDDPACAFLAALSSSKPGIKDVTCHLIHYRAVML